MGSTSAAVAKNGTASSADRILNPLMRIRTAECLHLPFLANAFCERPPLNDRRVGLLCLDDSVGPGMGAANGELLVVNRQLERRDVFGVAAQEPRFDVRDPEFCSCNSGGHKLA